jgi:hypothetical protein
MNRLWKGGKLGSKGKNHLLAGLEVGHLLPGREWADHKFPLWLVRFYSSRARWKLVPGVLGMVFWGRACGGGLAIAPEADFRYL